MKKSYQSFSIWNTHLFLAAGVVMFLIVIVYYLSGGLHIEDDDEFPGPEDVDDFFKSNRKEKV